MARGQASLTWGPLLTCTRGHQDREPLLTDTATQEATRTSALATEDQATVLTVPTPLDLEVSTQAILPHRASSTHQPRDGMDPVPLLVKEALHHQARGWELQEVPQVTVDLGGLTLAPLLVTMDPVITALDLEAIHQATQAPGTLATLAAPPPQPTVSPQPQPPALSRVIAVKPGRQ